MSTFIGQGVISSQTCKNLINLFNQSPKNAGTVWRGDDNGNIKPSEKTSTECSYEMHDSHLTDYLKELQIVLQDYIIQYPYCNFYSEFTIKERIKIQYYKPGEGYVAYHTERGSSTPINSTRHLVFMTYLNTVTDGGGTEFFHQNVITSAEQGKTLIWPADWTHTHRGVVSTTQEKYIITGWYNFV